MSGWISRRHTISTGTISGPQWGDGNPFHSSRIVRFRKNRFSNLSLSACPPEPTPFGDGHSTPYGPASAAGESIRRNGAHGRRKNGQTVRSMQKFRFLTGAARERSSSTQENTNCVLKLWISESAVIIITLFWMF